MSGICCVASEYCCFDILVLLFQLYAIVRKNVLNQQAHYLQSISYVLLLVRNIQTDYTLYFFIDLNELSDEPIISCEALTSSFHPSGIDKLRKSRQWHRYQRKLFHHYFFFVYNMQVIVNRNLSDN